MVSSTRGKTNEGMWNSPTHAMSDISSLAYRRNVPPSEVIVPVEVVAQTVQAYEPPRNGMLKFGDVSWNKPISGRGRGALLQNRDALHRNDHELKKQLRLANGMGYSNEVIEAKFQNSSPSRSFDDEDLDITSSDGTISTEEEGASPKNRVVEEVEEDDISIKENGEWNWEKRTIEPPRNRVILKNVALESLKRKQKAKQAEETVHAREIPSYASPGREGLTPAAAPAHKEDWRAENKAAEQAARRAQIPQEVAVTSKAKKGWRSEPAEPLLGDLKIDTNWSLFAPRAVTPPPHEAPPLFVTLLPVAKDDPSTTPEPGQQTVAKSLLEQAGLEMPRKKNKKKNKNVRVLYVAPIERSFPEPNCAPPGYMIPINGVSPMALRNPDYCQVPTRDMHRTFGNLFGQLGEGKERGSYQASESFSLDDFPCLK